MLIKSIGFVLILFFLLSAVIINTDPNTEIELGRKLFFDPILSIDSTISCASCHKPEFAFADNRPISPGVGGRLGNRNAPSVMNMSARRQFFYDGRAKNLEDQVSFPIVDQNEMSHNIEALIYKLKEHPNYIRWFEKIYNAKPNLVLVSKAIARFEKSLETSNTEFDAYMNGNPNKMTDSAIRGRQIFMSDKAKCFDCHFSPDFTADDFKNIGLYDEKKYADKGRYLITGIKEDLGKFKVPRLRNVAMTAPYMHDGSFATLKDVIEYYSDPYKLVSKPINMDSTLVKPILFTEAEKKDLEAFLISLTDKMFLK